MIWYTHITLYVARRQLIICSNRKIRPCIGPKLHRTYVYTCIQIQNEWNNFNLTCNEQRLKRLQSMLVLVNKASFNSSLNDDLCHDCPYKLKEMSIMWPITKILKKLKLVYYQLYRVNSGKVTQTIYFVCIKRIKHRIHTVFLVLNDVFIRLAASSTANKR
jgi:hypothetical protein